MNASYIIDPQVLLTTARVHAALEIIPHLVQPKEEWQHWMRDNLALDVFQKFPKPSESSPHPRFFESLHRMLSRHYQCGATLDTLCFHEVRADDSSVTGPCYVDVPLDALPDLKGEDFWWKFLPPSVSLRVPEQPRLVSDDSRTQEALQHLGKNCPSNGPFTEVIGTSGMTPNLTNQEEQREGANNPSDAPGIQNLSTSGSASNLTGKRRTSEPEEQKRSRKKRKVAVVLNSVPSAVRKSGNTHAGPSTGIILKGKSKVDVPVRQKSLDASKDCDACNTRGLRCVWPTSNPSASRNEKRACTRCASQKIKCVIGDDFNSPVRGKAIATRSSIAPDMVRNEMTQLSIQLSDRIMDLEKNQAAKEEEQRKLVTRVANLELQVSRLKRFKA